MNSSILMKCRMGQVSLNPARKTTSKQTILKTKLIVPDLPAVTYFSIILLLSYMTVTTKAKPNQMTELDRILFAAVHLPCCK